MAQKINKTAYFFRDIQYFYIRDNVSGKINIAQLLCREITMLNSLLESWYTRGDASY